MENDGKKLMKIVIVGTAYPMRGAMAQLNAILSKYLSEDHDVEIFSFKRQYPKILFPGKSQMDTRSESITGKIETNPVIDSINPLSWRKAGEMIASKNPDLLILRYWIPFFAPAFYSICKYVKKRTGAKVLFICDNVIPHEKRPGDAFLTKLIFKIGDYFVIHSKSVESDLKKFNIHNKPVLLYPHPVYNIFGEKISKAESKKFIKNEFNIDLTNIKVLLFFGYIRKYKGLDYLLKALPQILKKEKVKLLVVGEFYEDENRYKDLIKSLGIENDVIVFSDYIPNEQVRYFFCGCDVVILPYTGATQSGITQIAYFYDKPVIAADVGGLSEVVIDNKTGFVVKPENPSAIAEAVIRYYKENKEDEFVNNVKEEKKKYEWEGFVNELVKLVKK
jgi:glycosyltransferase involved in cell wall biosynthesis